MKENCEKEFFLLIAIDSKCLSIGRRKKIIKLSADSAFSFLGIGSKTKTQNWPKVFYNRFYRKLGFPNFKQRSSNVS